MSDFGPPGGRNVRSRVHRWHSHFWCLLSMPRDEFVPFLTGYGTPMNWTWFKQDGATPHNSNAVLHLLRDISDEGVLSNRYTALIEKGSSWPATSTDLNPCDCFLWEYFMDSVSKKYAPNSGLKTAIQSWNPFVQKHGSEQFCSSSARSSSSSGAQHGKLITAHYILHVTFDVKFQV
jgi:hypothetical protein